MICKLKKSQGGQIVIATAIIVPFLIMLFCILLKISLLVHQKIKLQNAVDAGVYSAAASYARDLNYIAFLNSEIDSMWHGDGVDDEDVEVDWSQSYEKYLDDTAYNDKIMAVNLLNKYIDDYVAFLRRMEYVSSTAYEKAQAYGRQAALLTYYNGDTGLAAANSSGLTFEPHPKTSGYSPNPEDHAMFINYGENNVPTSIPYVKLEGGCNPIWDACEAYDYISNKVNIPFEKLSDSNVKFIARARVGNLAAYARGQPYGGNIKEFLNTYGAALTPIGKLNLGEFPGSTTTDEVQFYH